MTVIHLLISSGLSILALFLLFGTMERLFQAKEQRVFRPAWLTDLWFLLGQYLLWSGVVFWLLVQFKAQLDSVVPGDFRAAVAAQPWWAQAVEMIVLTDFLIYWAHRLQHAVPFLWRFHAIHHSAEHLDWLAAHREHPLDTVYTMGVINLPAFAMGFPLETLAGFIAFRGIWAIYIHANVRLPLKPLRWLIGSPELHHWHHDKARDAGNYANLSPLMDLLFGTYRCPDHEPEAFGIREPIAPSYSGQLWHPFKRRNRARSAGKPLPDGVVEDGAP
jgi:sterol desaturase/sphingolipid hydroxylase (fatty acid hydroxylase superfamily)